MIIGIDHILVAVESVERASELYKTLGFQVQPGGEHPGMGTYNALIPLADGSYLELIGVRDPALAVKWPNARLMVEALSGDNRLATFALETNDIVGDVAELRSKGLTVGDPIEGERVRPDGEKVAWKTAHFDDPHLPFLIQDITPHHVRVPLPTSGLGAEAYLAEVSLAVDRPGDSSRFWKIATGKEPGSDGRLMLERTAIRLGPAEGQARGIYALTLAVDNLDRHLADMKQRGIKVGADRGPIELDRAATAGARVRLIAAA